MINEKTDPAFASKWFKSRKWAHGLDLEAHKSTDSLEFFLQYSKDSESWDKAFAWLKNTDLQKLTPGKYHIDDDRVFVIVTEGNTKKAEDAKWEAHQKYIDIQYVVYGKEKMGVAPLSKTVGIDPFNQDKDIGFYEIPEADCKYYTAEPGYFFLFFPNDAHRPSIAIKGHEKVKKIVIKVKVV